MEVFLMKKVLIGLVGVAALGGFLVNSSIAQIAQSDCPAKVKANFDWAKRGRVAGTAEFPEYAKVFATVIRHDRGVSQPRATIWYGDGGLSLATVGGEEVLTGKLNGWVNDYKTAAPATGSGVNVGTVAFSSASQIQFEVILRANSLVSIQALVGGKPFLGRPPVTLRACGDTPAYIGGFEISMTQFQSR
jgi:hypothetical protein